MNTVLNRPALKAQARELLRTAQVSPKAFMVLYYSVLVLLDVLISFLPSEGLAGMFITTLSELFSWVLGAGLVLYFMGTAAGSAWSSPHYLMGFPLPESSLP